MAALKKIPGAKVLFGGELLDPKTHSIPDCYGSFQPTAVQVRPAWPGVSSHRIYLNAMLPAFSQVPLREFLKPEHYSVCTTEIFGPFQVRYRHHRTQYRLLPL